MDFKAIGDFLTLIVALTFWFDYKITTNFEWVNQARFGLTLTPLAGYILLLLTKLIGGHFGVALTIVDFLVSIALTVDLEKLFGHVFLIFILSLSLSLLNY